MKVVRSEAKIKAVSQTFNVYENVKHSTGIYWEQFGFFKEFFYLKSFINLIKYFSNHRFFRK